jgi:hypothetical protein
LYPPPIFVDGLLFRWLALPVTPPLLLLFRYVAVYLVTLHPLDDGAAVIPLIGPNPAGVIEQLYERLELGDFNLVREAVVAETKRRRGYQAKGSLPSDLWRQRISNEWAAILTQHATLG